MASISMMVLLLSMWGMGVPFSSAAVVFGAVFVTEFVSGVAKAIKES